MRPSLWLGAGLLLAVLAGLLVVRPGWSTGPFAGAIPVGSMPSAVALDAHTGHAVVTNYADDTVSLLDARSGATLGTIPVGHAPISVAVNGRTGRAFIINAGDDSVSVLDLATGVVVQTLALVPNPGGVCAVAGLAVDEQSGHVFVAGGPAVGGQPGAVTMLDGRSGRVLHTASLGAGSLGVAVDPRTHRVFVTNLLDDTVSVLDTASGRVVRTTPVGAHPMNVAVDARSGRAFVTNSFANTVSVLDAHSGAILRTVAVGRTPQTLAVDAHAGRVFVVNAGDGTLSVLDARTGVVQHTVTIGTIRPQPVATDMSAVDVVADEHAGRAFIVNGSAVDRNGIPTPGSVAMLDAQSGHVLRTVTVGRDPLAMAVDETTGQLFVVNTGPEGTPGGPTVWGQILAVARRWFTWLPQPLPPSHNGTVTVLGLTRM